MRFTAIAAILLLNGSVDPVVAEELQAPELKPETELVTPETPETVQGRLRVLNEDLAGGVRPSENAAVYLIQMFGAGVVDEELRDNAMSMLGIRMLPVSREYLSPDAFLAASEPGPFDELPAELARARERVWTSKELPLAAAYVDANAMALDATGRIVALNRYYVPLLSTESPPRILSASLDVEFRLQALAILLSTRALRQDSIDDRSRAISDLIACHRLGALLARQSPLDVSHAKAHFIDATACYAALELIRNGHLPAELARDYFRRLEEIGPLPRADLASDYGDRAALEQELEILGTDETTVREYLEIAAEKQLPQLEMSRLKDLDWEAASQRAKEVHDKIVAALRVTDRWKQEELFLAIDRDYDTWNARFDEMSRREPGVVDMDLATMSRWIGETVAMCQRTNYRQRRATDDRGDVRRHMVKLALSLVAFGGEKGVYPESLEELRPDYLRELPVDPYAETVYEYQRQPNGDVVVTCWGRNQTNDAGKIYNDDTILGLRQAMLPRREASQPAP